MPLSDVIGITIIANSPGASRAGFGTPLILSNTAAWTGNRVRSYTSLAAVAVDFASTTGPEYLAAAALFAQNPRPRTVKIARGDLKATMVQTLVPVVIDSHTYTLRVKGDGVTSTEVSFTSGVGTTATLINDGLRTALNAVVGKNYTATGTTTLIVTGTAAGEWFSIELDKIADWTSIAQTHVDPGVATDLAAIALEDADWYGLVTMYNSNAVVLAAAVWIEANSRLYLADVVENQALTTAVTNSDTLDDLHTAAYARTAPLYHHRPDQMFAARLFGRCLPLTPGSETWALKRLAGIDPTTDLANATYYTNLTARKGIGYRTLGGVNVTFLGTTASGEYIDIIRGRDWLEDDMRVAIFNALIAEDKVPFTNGGIAKIVAEVEGSLDRAVKAGILADDAISDTNPNPFFVTFPDISDVSDADKAARLLSGIEFAAKYAGAIHAVDCTGTITV